MSPDSSPRPARITAAAGHACDDGGAIDGLVDAVRRYRDAERAMRGRSRDSMHLGRTDMTALRLMLQAGRAGLPLSAAALARKLEISTAATTVLIDRLEKSGHAERRRSATDGRAIEIWPTTATDEEVRSTMGVMHERMMAIAAELPESDCAIIRRFLTSLGTAMDRLDFPDPHPASPHS